MMQDIKRICENPTAEDREWFPDFAGDPDWRSVLKHIWANYRDEAFIQQFLSPNLIRRLKLFRIIKEKNGKPHWTVTDIHDDTGYRNLRYALAQMHDISVLLPDVQIVKADMLGTRRLHLEHMEYNEVPLEISDLQETLRHVRSLWGYGVSLDHVNADSGVKRMTTLEGVKAEEVTK
jgi:stage V sporulation protein R